jgi:hypothetical protein
MQFPSLFEARKSGGGLVLIPAAWSSTHPSAMYWWAVYILFILEQHLKKNYLLLFVKHLAMHTIVKNDW